MAVLGRKYLTRLVARASGPMLEHCRISFWSALVALATLACGTEQDAGIEPPQCPALLPSAAPTVAGVFDYASQLSPVYGTISFEQTGQQVSVTDTSYANADDRALEGEGALDANRLEITLTPKNGDTDYEAQVDFVFSEDGSVFCLLGFTDTNGDEGGPGSHHGRRRGTTSPAP